MKGYFLIITFIFLTACSAMRVYDEINFDIFNSMVEKKDDFILFVSSDDCQSCDRYELTMNNVIEKYNVDIKYINLSNLSEKDRGLFVRRFSISKLPVLMFFDDGDEINTYKRLVGNIKYSKIVSRLKENNYIKG